MLKTSWQYREFTIRPWQPGDRAAAADIIRQVLEEYGLPWEPDRADRDVIAVEEHYLQRGGEFWVVERQSQDLDKTEIVGTGAYYPIPRHQDKAVEIRKMYLLPAARGRGVGQYLLAQI
ncbi:MAG: GNAT family N-acetyltransferase, partial [Cyanobacteria bacterium J06641_5]